MSGTILKFRSTMVSANDKGKKLVEDDLQDPKQEEEIEVEVVEGVEEDKHPHTRATIASIGVVANPVKLKRTARMSTGGKVPRLCLSPR